MKNRIIAMLMLVVMLLPTLVACGDGGKTTTPSASVDGSGTTVDPNDPYDPDGYLKDSIPDDINYGDKTINLLCWEDSDMVEFEVESATGEHVVEDSIYYRNLAVEERLGVKLNFIFTPGNSSNHGDYIAKVEQAARGGTGDYDILASYSRTIAGTVLGGYGVNLLEFDVLDFDAPWWSHSLVNTSTVNGRLYYASGDISTNLMYMMNCTFFNTAMITDLGLENPYDLVTSDQWTMTKMFDMGAGLYSDINANYTKDDSDQYGTVLVRNNLDGLFYGAGITLSVMEDGIPQFSDAYLGTPMRDWIVKMIEAFHESNDGYYITENRVRNIFGENRAVFLVDTPIAVPKNLDFYEDCVYGIVPVPKWDTTQEDYCTGVRFLYTLYTLFAGSPDLERAATVLECMASESHRKVMPAVFEITMKYQYSLDDIASRMFDTILSTIVYDFARDFSMELPQTPNSIYWGKIASQDKDWVAFIGKSERILRNSLANIINSLEKNYGR